MDEHNNTKLSLKKFKVINYEKIENGDIGENERLNALIHYDFVVDTLKTDKKIEEYKQLDGVEKYFIYMADKYSNTHSGLFNVETKEETINKVNKFRKKAKGYGTKDPDGYSGLLQNIYIDIWPEIVKQEFVKQHTKKYVKIEMNEDRFHIASDTMTSATTLVSSVLRNIDKKEYIEIYEKGKIFASANVGVVLAGKHGKDFYNDLNEVACNIESFLEVYHTIGNYCPIPEGVNTKRSRGRRYDFWDLTLMKIKEWYEANNDVNKRKILMDLLHIHGEEDDVLKKCNDWLAFFGYGDSGWQKFIDIMMFQDFVKVIEVDTDNKKYGDVIPFWEGHSWDKTELPSVEIINEAFVKISNMIKARSKKLIEKLSQNQ